MNYVESRDTQNSRPVQLYYEDFGHGQPVVLIHGWPLSHEMWEYQIHALVASGCRVIAYDRRGFGKSSKPWYGYDYDTLADDLKIVLQELDLHDVTLVGFSMGGGEVVRYFSRHHGERVAKAVLLGSVTPFMLQTDDNPGGVEQAVFDSMIDQIKEDRIGFLDAFGKDFFGVSMLHKPISDPLLDYYKMLGSQASPTATIDCVQSFALTDFRKEMSSVTVPTLIIHGEADKTVPIDATAKRAAEMIRDNRLLVYDGAPHGLFYTHRARLNADLAAFIQADVTTVA
ncbi:MAG TPA: alpha/beta hydrolase [Ohtaekwangia sp.]|nr:alpha/beta hydrolase [Ohtaekwangia sp.]